MRRTRSLSEQLAERLRYEAGIAQCSRCLIAGGPRAIETALEHLRAAAGASRVYLFENFQDPQDGLCIRQTFEACAPGVSAQIDNPLLRKLRYDQGYDMPRRLLEQGKPFYATTETMQPQMRDLLAPQGILSILNIPVNVGGAWYGFIGFDDTAIARAWSDQDVRLLHTGAEMIGAHIGRERAIEELARRQATLDTIFRTMPIGIGMVVGRVFTVANARLCGITGYTTSELLGKSARILYATDAEFERLGTVLRASVSRDGTGTAEARWLRKDGRVIDVLLSTTPIDPENLAGDYLFAAQDITARAAAEREQHAMEAQLEHIQRLESLGVLAGGVAHDFNNLLMVILGNIELVETDPALPPALNKSLTEMSRAVRHGADLTRQLLAYAGKGKMLVEKLDVSAVIREMQAIVTVSLAKKARVEYRLADGLPSVEMDATQLRQVIMNLLSNASEALGPGGGDIVVATGILFMDGAALSTAVLGPGLAPGRYVFLEVSDTGQGMDSVTREKIFDPFYTTKFPGRGLGLAAVHGIVRAHRGCITVTSAVDVGTVFRVLMPEAAR